MVVVLDHTLDVRGRASALPAGLFLWPLIWGSHQPCLLLLGVGRQASRAGNRDLRLISSLLSTSKSGNLCILMYNSTFSVFFPSQFALPVVADAGTQDVPLKDLCYKAEAPDGLTDC